MSLNISVRKKRARFKRRFTQKTAVVITAMSGFLLTTATAFAHPAHVINSLPSRLESFSSGVLHPFSGIDHVIVMLAIGLWASQLGKRDMYLVPATFVSMMIAGSFLPATLVVSTAESLIMASVIVFSLLLVTKTKMPLWSGMLIAGFFALFHGYAHITEVGAYEPLNYTLGFVAATGILHLIGLGIGQIVTQLKRRLILN